MPCRPGPHPSQSPLSHWSMAHCEKGLTLLQWYAPCRPNLYDAPRTRYSGRFFSSCQQPMIRPTRSIATPDQETTPGLRERVLHLLPRFVFSSSISLLAVISLRSFPVGTQRVLVWLPDLLGLFLLSLPYSILTPNPRSFLRQSDFNPLSTSRTITNTHSARLAELQALRRELCPVRSAVGAFIRPG